MSNTVIKLKNLGKRYFIGSLKPRYKTLRDTITESLSIFNNIKKKTNNSKNESIWALQNISFEINKGDVLGIIGRNGAGKSTLLKILSRITEPTVGYAVIEGRVSSLLEIGIGFHPELTGRENIFLNGAILGMKKNEIKSKFDEIVDFAEIERFIDTPVKYYSSGMYVRLAFAVAAHLETDILLVDEILSVGDEAFQKKCLGKMQEVAGGGRTVLFVSHNMRTVGTLCNSCIRLEKGEIVDIGNTRDVINNYLKSFEISSEEDFISENKRINEYIQNDKVLRITRVSLKNSRGEKTKNLFFKEPFFLTIIFQIMQPTEGARIGIDLYTMDGVRISTSHHTDSGLEPLRLSEGFYSIQVKVKNNLNPGDYVLGVGAHDIKTKIGLEHIPRAILFSVNEFSNETHEMHDAWNAGYVQMETQWSEIKNISDS